FLAFCHYDRHQVRPGHLATLQFTVDGRPMYPQRPPFPMTELRATTRADVHTGRFDGKMIMVHNTVDDYAWPHGAVTYERLVRAHLGDATDSRYRVWFNDNAAHIPGSVFGPPMTSRLVDYFGSVEEAIRQLIEWVEADRAPAASTAFEWDEQSGRLVLPPAASERRGVQPVVHLTVDGGQRAEVAAGTAVTLEAVAETPAGTIVALEWDPEGLGKWPAAEDGV